MVDEFKRPGKKAGRGFYEYPENGKKFLWKEIGRIFPGATNQHAVNQPDVEEVKKRLLYIQGLEAVKCLEEHIITKPADGDIGSVLGWGFAPFTGGALSFIDGIGLKEFVAECDNLAKKYGKRFMPTKGLKEMAEMGKCFYS
jgi:3-hydroxyacyl-CoA dehydrogenase/enoyl-CoA hydratase/3-hydroxybutyryl-CoA epimerase